MNKSYLFGKLIGKAIKKLSKIINPGRDYEVNQTQKTTEYKFDYYWQPSGHFVIQVVGESFYRPTITKITKNSTATHVLIFCTATLIPENQNEFDPNAISIEIQGEKVGHLSKENAIKFREYLKNFGVNNQITICDAVIHGGGIYSGREYSYSIELDLNLNEPSINFSQQTPTYQRMLVSDEVTITKHSERDIEIRLNLVDLSILQKCSIGNKVKLWTKDDMDEIYFFSPKSIGGNGRMAVIEKKRIPELAENINAVFAIIEQINGRSCIIRCNV